MALFRRKPKLPADQRPALEPDERILAWAPTSDAGVVVATNRGLWLPGLHRMGWHEVHKAVWSGRELVVTPAAVVGEGAGYTVVADQPILSTLLLDPGDVPDQVRARVTRSVAYTEHHPLPEGGGVRVVARRVSGVDGLTWTVRYDPGTPKDEATVDDLVAAARATTTPA
ncbi:hypothetical protein RB614_00650 [Phytohabitans sp. ZYX-F-186]|uniref:Uncharacterized protein n=1 Tax=Phytohabitans maris TaxID=3071409 RepID=A0ABU0Z7K1_9ACTN|nr:hypothetical protein [Phytohabitans sp. ZYX-F-186]MDQ7903028.1 hypothetical protein [Phytohabitans sp. ZYX-F-186]